jgi:hypothetical protein
MDAICACAFEDYVVQCQENIVVNAHLEPLTEFTWRVIDKFGNHYSGQVTTNEQGQVTIPVTNLPDGFLTQFSGVFTLQFFEDAGFCTPAPVKMAKVYSGIEFTVKPGNYEKNNLGCELLQGDDQVI